MSNSNFIGDTGQSAALPNAAPHYDLRPLSTGEVLDRTFQIYRSRFALFAGLALLPAGVNTISSALRLALLAHPNAHAHLGAAHNLALITYGAVSILAGLLSLVLYGITQAATTWALSAVYLGEAASIKTAYKAAFKHWFRYTLVVLRQIWAGIWLPFTLIMAAVLIPVWTRRHGGSLTWLVVLLVVLASLSFIYGIWAYIRLSLAVPAAVVESLRIRSALRRSAQLMASRKIRVFLLFLLLAALYMVIGTMESPLLILAVRTRGTEAFVMRAVQLTMNFAAATLIGPIGAIGLCLFYFDERVRREGFDIEWMMRKVAPAELSGTEPPSPGQDTPAELA